MTSTEIPPQHITEEAEAQGRWAAKVIPEPANSLTHSVICIMAVTSHNKNNYILIK